MPGKNHPSHFSEEFKHRIVELCNVCKLIGERALSPMS